MAETERKRRTLTEDQKAETRAAVAAYKAKHPTAKYPEIRANLDLPYKEDITEGVLRGLARGQGGGGAKADGAGQSAPKTRAPKGTRGRNVEMIIKDLNALRKQREGLDRRIEALEGELRGRMHLQLGQDHAGRIFGGVVRSLGEAAGRVTEVAGQVGDRVGDAAGRVGDTAQRVTSAVGERVGDVAGRVTGNGGER
ncbi:MAG TPA: hypothetical protein VM536_14485 [Chloroflexia bacterium]|nr:hypothetical protein [Chloroflexia bacterium]